MIEYVRDNNMNQPDLKSSKPKDVLSKKAYSYHQKAEKLFAGSQFNRAKEFYEKSLESYREEGDSFGAGLALTRLGRTKEILGEYAQARKIYEESLALFQSLSDLQGIARSQAHLGNVGWAVGDYQEAARLLQEAFSFYHVAEDVSGEAWVHDLLGNLRLAMREDEQAEHHYRTAYSLVSGESKNLQVEGWNHYHLAALDFFRENFIQAKEGFAEALQCFTRLKDDLGQVASLIHLGEASCALKRLSEAEDHFQKAVRLVLPTDCKPLLADAVTGVAQLLKAKGDERKAISLLMVALSHPTCRQQTKDRMVALAMDLQSSFSPKEAQEGFQWAKAVSLEEMASSWVNSTSAKTKNPKRG